MRKIIRIAALYIAAKLDKYSYENEQENISALINRADKIINWIYFH